jgi:hypothetical protein
MKVVFSSITYQNACNIYAIGTTTLNISPFVQNIHIYHAYGLYLSYYISSYCTLVGSLVLANYAVC